MKKAGHQGERGNAVYGSVIAVKASYYITGVVLKVTNIM